MLIARMDDSSPPAPVAESWRRIEEWLDEHLPAVKATLRPGVSRKHLSEFEKLVGRALPEDVRESWRIHDGQGHIPNGSYAASDGPVPGSLGLVFGQELIPLLDSGGALYSHAQLDAWKFWEVFIVNEERGEDGGLLAEFSEKVTSSPPGAIRRLHADRGWIPLVGMGAQTSNHIGIDLDPAPAGVIGQVINFGGDEEAKYVLATSWGRFLEDFADELEAGNFDIDIRRQFEEFLLKEPPGKLFQEYEAWSRAKVPRDFPGAAPP
jgi:cell wall assembly regulator SMI1